MRDQSLVVGIEDAAQPIGGRFNAKGTGPDHPRSFHVVRSLLHAANSCMLHGSRGREGYARSLVYPLWNKAVVRSWKGQAGGGDPSAPQGRWGGDWHEARLIRGVANS